MKKNLSATSKGTEKSHIKKNPAEATSSTDYVAIVIIVETYML